MKPLYETLMNYEPFNEQERVDKQLMLRYLREFDDVFDRSNPYGHFTSSPWIINQDNTRVLMIYHNIYDSWGWCGGHCDGNQDVQQVAIQEGKEETGISSLKPVVNDIFSIEVLPVLPHIKHGAFVSAHVHLNITFLCQGDEREQLRSKPDENSGVKWISLDDVDCYVREEDMKPVYHKLISKASYYGNKHHG